MFLGLIKNEFIKLFAKKKTYIILVLFLGLSVIIAVMAKKQEDDYLRSIDPQFRVSRIEEEIGYAERSLEDIKTNTDIPDAEREEILADNEEYLANLKQDLEAAKAQLENPSASDWRVSAEEELKNYKEALANTKDKDSVNYFEKEIRRLEMHLEKDIPTTESMMNQGFNYLKSSLMVIMTGFLAFGLILFNADVMSGEYNPGTLKFLLIQPVTRVKVLLAKYLVAMITSVALILGVQLLFTAGVGILNGFGSPDLPVFMGERYQAVLQEGNRYIVGLPGTGTFGTTTEYLLKSLLLEALFIAAMGAFILLVSVVSKSTVISFTVLIGTLLGTNIIYTLSAGYRKVSAYLFLHQGNADGIITGTIMRETGNLSYTFGLSVAVLTLSTVAMVGASMMVFKKRDILI